MSPGGSCCLISPCPSLLLLGPHLLSGGGSWAQAPSIVVHRGTPEDAGMQDPETEAGCVAMSALMQPPAHMPLQLGAQEDGQERQEQLSPAATVFTSQQYLPEPPRQSCVSAGALGTGNKREWEGGWEKDSIKEEPGNV